MIWDVSTGKTRATLRGHSGAVTELAFAPNGLLASVSGDKTIKLWDAVTATELATLRGHTSDIVAVAFSPDGSFLASGSLYDGTVKLWKPTMQSSQLPRLLPN